MILVCVATGTVGSEVVRSLCGSGQPTRALVRSPGKADAMRGYDCETAIGNYDDAASLDAAFAGTDAVFVVSPPGEQQVLMETAAVDAATRAGARVVKLAALGWQTGAIGRLGDVHRQIVDYLAASGLPYSVLAPNDYLQNLLQSAAQIQSAGVLALPLGDAAVASIDARDVAAVAVHLLTAGGHDRASYDLTGPQALTKTEVARRMSVILGREVRYVDADPAEARAGMLDVGMDEWLVDALMELYAAYRAGYGSQVTDEVRKATGREPRSVDDFVADYRRAFV